MSPENESLAARLKASAASQAWYEYMLKGGTPRVMSPMDEMTWFETVQTQEVFCDNVSIGWTPLCDTNPRRIAVMLGVAAQRLYFDFTKVPPDLNVIDDVTQLLWVWFGAPPDVDGLYRGYKLPSDGGILTITQKELGPACQGQIWGISSDPNDSTVLAIPCYVTEVLLKDFPKQ